MVKVVVTEKTSKRKFELDVDPSKSAIDLKNILSSKINKSSTFFFEGEPLSENTVLGTLGESIEITVEQDIEFSSINCENKIQDCIINALVEPVISRSLTEIEGESIMASLEPNLFKESDIKSLSKEKEGSVVKESREVCDDNTIETIMKNDLEPSDKQNIETVSKNTFDNQNDSFQKIRLLSEDIKRIPLVKVNTANGSKYVKKSEIFEVNGKKYLVTSRTKKINLKFIVNRLKLIMSKPLLIQSLILSLILLTNNHFLFLVILMIKLLKLISRAFVDTHNGMNIESCTTKAFVSFFASLFLIDHEELYRT